MTKSKSKLILALVAVSLTALSVLLVGVLMAPVAPPQPVYQGMTLQQWIRAEPNMPITTADDNRQYRSEALAKMGQPAVGYLLWMIRNPGLALDGYSSRWDRLRERLPEKLRKFAPPKRRRADRADLTSVVAALQLVGPNARDAARDLIKLWDSNKEHAYYAGFPLTLAALGDASPRVLAALHQRFDSPDRTHRALCAFAAWQLNPKDAVAVGRLRAELSSTDSDDPHTRYVLLGRLSLLGSGSAPFLAEIEALISKSNAADTWHRQTAALAAWRLLNVDKTARDFLKQLAGRVAGTSCSKSDSDLFSATALSLVEIPGTHEITVPCLKQLSEHPDASSASFASNILTRVEAAVQVGRNEPKPPREGAEGR